MKKTLMSWSSGKDSAWALYRLKQNPEFEILGLFTSVNRKYERASMHATRTAMLERQADASGLPLQTLRIPDPCTNEQYAAVMRNFVAESTAKGIEYMAFGDLYLEDVRTYREDNLKGTGIRPVFPIWKIPTQDLAEQMLSAGVEAYISCVDLKKLPAGFAGRKWSRELIAGLPEGCDPCGENGEFHTIVAAGPMFKKSIPVRVGEIVERDGFAFADIVPL